VIACAGCWLFIMTGSYALLYWIPQLVRQMIPHGTELAIGAISSLPQAGLIVGMLANARSSDRSRERLMHFAVPSLLSGAALLLASVASGPAIILALLVLAGAGIGAAQGVFWTLPGALGIGNGHPPVGVIAVLNMAGTLGGVVGPALLGATRQATGSFSAGIACLAILLVLSAPTALSMRKWALSE
jgi:ACS family tartrate transporter-like MFS transporter